MDLKTARRKFYSAEDVNRLSTPTKKPPNLIDSLLLGDYDEIHRLCKAGHSLETASEQECEHLLFDAAFNGDLERFSVIIDLLGVRAKPSLTKRVIEQILMWRDVNMLIYLGYRNLLTEEMLTYSREMRAGVRTCHKTIESFLRTGRPATP
jgi:hypothetical protein